MSDNTINDPEINYPDYAYYLTVCLGSPTHMLYAVQIYYEYKEIYLPLVLKTGVPAGNYFVQVKLRNIGGDVLALETQEFTLGITGGEVTALTVTPATFAAGDSITITMTFENTGAVPITGTAVILVTPADAFTVTAEFSHTIANLAPGASVIFNDVWDTTGAT